MEYSTVVYGSGIALGAAIRYLLEAGIPAILQHDKALADELATASLELGGKSISPSDRSLRTGIATVSFDGWDAKELWSRLAEENIYTSARLGAIRFSAHLYNNSEDVGRVLEALEKVLRSGG
jgi:selenocysteine lyase/cysteine desulfurase